MPTMSASARRSSWSPARRFRLVALAEERGWTHLRLYSDEEHAPRDFVHPEDADVPGLNVFTRRDGAIRHFWETWASRRTPARTRAARPT